MVMGIGRSLLIVSLLRWYGQGNYHSVSVEFLKQEGELSVLDGERSCRRWEQGLCRWETVQSIAVGRVNVRWYSRGANARLNNKHSNKNRKIYHLLEPRLLEIERTNRCCSETGSVTALICSDWNRTELNISVSLKCELDRWRHNYMQL